MVLLSELTPLEKTVGGMELVRETKESCERECVIKAVQIVLKVRLKRLNEQLWKSINGLTVDKMWLLLRHAAKWDSVEQLDAWLEEHGEEGSRFIRIGEQRGERRGLVRGVVANLQSKTTRRLPKKLVKRLEKLNVAKLEQLLDRVVTWESWAPLEAWLDSEAESSVAIWNKRK